MASRCWRYDLTLVVGRNTYGDEDQTRVCAQLCHSTRPQYASTALKVGCVATLHYHDLPMRLLASATQSAGCREITLYFQRASLRPVCAESLQETYTMCGQSTKLLSGGWEPWSMAAWMEPSLVNVSIDFPPISSHIGPQRLAAMHRRLRNRRYIVTLC